MNHAGNVGATEHHDTMSKQASMRMGDQASMRMSAQASAEKGTLASKRRRRLGAASALTALFALAAGCGGAQVQIGKPVAPSSDGTPAAAVPVGEAASRGFAEALQQMVAHDKASDWSDASCSSVSKAFLDASARQRAETKKDLLEALYNAGLVAQRCGKHADAKAQYKAVLDADAKFHRARVQIALYEWHEKGDPALEGVMAQLKQAVTDAQFQNVEALVNLAMLQMKRNGQGAEEDGSKNDFERAKRNLQRALAIDDGYQPAFNQLALYYFDTARAKVGAKAAKAKFATFAKTKRADVQQLELAALVCSQAIRKNAAYAPIHNTAGLIQIELENVNGAVQEFQAAVRLDPSFFEAQMNYAAVNLSFRGFKSAEDAYRAALKMRPNDFDAHLGLALALRGQIDDSNFEKNVAAAQAELDACKKLAPERAETYYNEAILTQEYKAKGGNDAAVPMLEQAATIFDLFVQKAAGAAEFADAVKRSKDRAQDIRDTVKFIKEGQTAAAIEAARQEKEREEAQAEAAADGGAPAPSPEAPATPAPAPAKP